MRAARADREGTAVEIQDDLGITRRFRAADPLTSHDPARRSQLLHAIEGRSRNRRRRDRQAPLEERSDHHDTRAVGRNEMAQGAPRRP